MTNYEVNLNSTQDISPRIRQAEEFYDRVVYVNNSAVVDLSRSIQCVGLVVGMATTEANSAGTVDIHSPHIIKFTDTAPLTEDARIVWANDGSREVNRGSGLVVENLSSSGWGNGTKGAGIRESGIVDTSSVLKLWFDMQTLDATTGKMVDIAANDTTSNNGSIFSCLDAPGKFGRCREFQGGAESSSEGIEVADDAELEVDTFSLACWVNVDVITGTRAMMWKENAYGMRFNGTTLEVKIWDTVPTPTTYTRANFLSSSDIGQWVHVTVTYNNTDVRVYRNGTLFGTPDARTATTNQSGTNQLFIGKEASGVSIFDGKIDEVGLYNFPLVSTTISLFLSASGKIGPTWCFDGSVGADIIITGQQPYPKMSFVCWFWPETLTTAASIISQGTTNNEEGFEFTVNTSGTIALSIDDWSGTPLQDQSRKLVSTATIPVGAWSHIGWTYDGFTIRLYINGTETISKTYPSYQPIKRTVNSVFIGESKSGGLNVSGRLDEIYLFNDAISASEVAAFYNLTESALPKNKRGLTITEVGTFQDDTSDISDLNVESSNFWALQSSATGIPRSPWPLVVQGTGWKAYGGTGSPSNSRNYELSGHSIGFSLQNTTSGLRDNFLFIFDSMNPLVVDDSGGDSIRTTTIERRGNIGRVKKIGFVPRKVRFVTRINLTKPGGISQLRRIQEIASTLYKESDIFNLYTDKHVLIGFQLTNYDETPVRQVPWKLIDVEIEFTKRVS